MKVLMLNYEFPPIGGGGGHAHEQLLHQYAHRSELSVDVLTAGLPQGRQPSVIQNVGPNSGKPLCRGVWQESIADNITLYKVPVHKKNLHYWRKVEVIEWLIRAGRLYRRLLRSGSYDLVHAFFAFPSGYLCWRSAKTVPYIISLRGSDVPGYNERLGLDYRLLSGLFRRIWSQAAHVVANSDGLRNLALQFMPALDIDVIPNGVDKTVYYPCDSRQSRQATDRSEGADSEKAPGRMRMLTTGRLIRRKRIDVLIDAVAAADRLGIAVELTIAGEGNLLEELRSTADQLGVLERVTFLGRVPREQIPDVYRSHDVFVMASTHEGMSNAMLEALACGLPIITTPCEGVAELVGDNGIIVEQATGEAIAQAIQQLTVDDASYERMRAAGRLRSEQFSWSVPAERYLSLYRDVAACTGGRSK